MAERAMYIGTRERLERVPAPKIEGYNNSPVGWASKQDFLNGGTRIRRSVATHREFSFSWNYVTRAEARKIMDLYGGLSGSGPIYFLDPFAMDQNLAPAHWAAPMQGAFDAPLLMGSTKPKLSLTTTADNLGYPINSAAYSGTSNKRTLYIPLPPGHTLWAGVHGPATGGSLTAAPVQGPVNVGTPVVLPKLLESDPVRVNTSFAASDGNVGVEFTVENSPNYTGFIVQVLQDGVEPATGGFISGQGHSGSDFVSPPVQTPYSAARDLVGVTVELAEVRDWQ